MILWLDGSQDPAENMRRDRALLAAAEVGAEPVLRLFAFEPHGITLGAREDAERTLDLERCRADAVPWAVRPTGGRAIFHAEEWTYSLAAPIPDPEWGGSQREAYLRTSGAIAASLRRLGVPAELARGERALDGRAAAGACFASTARHEIEIEGRKLVGSAQRRTLTGLLQQGSILLGWGHLRLADYLRLEPSARAELRERLASRSAEASAWIAPPAPLSRWAEALLAELPGRVRLVEGTAGLFLLTLKNAGSYTASLAQPAR
jgi:lipoate-protein ligase A